MSAQRLWVLLLLAAVFCMHGLQCVGPDVDAGHGTGAAAHAVVYLAAPAPLVDSTLAAVGHLVDGAPSDSGVLAAAAVLSQYGLPPHGAAFWAVCLAVLLTGILALGVAALTGRAPARFIRAGTPSSLWHTGWSRIPRPPDLSALCLLRI